MTRLRINNWQIEIAELPPLPPQLEQLDVSLCIKLRSLPALPPTLRQLNCEACTALEALPSSLSGTALSVLKCNCCWMLKAVPKLPLSVVDLQLHGCDKLLQWPELPKGLKCLGMSSVKLAQRSGEWKLLNTADVNRDV